QALILDGKVASAEIRSWCAEEVEALRRKHSILPGLAVVRVGEDPASVQYAGRIVKSFEATGLTATVFELPERSSRAALQAEIHRINVLAEFAAMLVQWPLPSHLNWEAVIDVIDPAKDVDGSHPINIGRFTLGLDSYAPATPAGGLALLDYYGIKLEGRRALVIGRSGIVGRPLAQLFLSRNATITVAHSHSRDLASLVAEADIVAVATGKPGLVRGEMLKEGAVVLDFGASVVDGQMRGDVDFESAVRCASAITPVPGGTGPMTNAMLIRNTLKAIHRNLG
ncbi:MAG: bifunctional 5,10-methylenetetrahydrofolate dehydrogenase/5,10-methenyltetrahydrofolate cyclohydrolase, partial [Chloroflexia bacterium]